MAQMTVGLVLSSVPGYSETFLRNKVRVLREAEIKVIVFVDKVAGPELDVQQVVGFRWAGSWTSRLKGLVIAGVRMARCPVRTYSLYALNRKNGFSANGNLVSLLTSAHILRFNLDWLHFGFATVALNRENVARAMGARLAVSIRGFDIAIHPLRNKDCYRLLWARLDKLHYISDDLLRLARSHGLNGNVKPVKICPAINTSFFDGRTRPPFLPPFQMVTVARLHWKKGLEYTLEALRIVKAAGVDFQYTIVGDGEEYERLRYCTWQLGIAESVRFAGERSAEYVREILAESHVYLHYSIQEGFSNSVLEAQAMGLPCIVSDAEGLAENVVHGLTGWVVPRRSPKLLARQILNVIGIAEAEWSSISENARSRVRSHFTLEKQQAEYLEFYRD
jgi:colanic acid/amylovoran biosynthesis glycosyltransferase